MSELSAPESVLAHIAEVLSRLGMPFALVGGLAVSVRGEVRFTRDVRLALVRANLRLIAERGYERDQDLEAKLDALLDVLERDG